MARAGRGIVAALVLAHGIAKGAAARPARAEAGREVLPLEELSRSFAFVEYCEKERTGVALGAPVSMCASLGARPTARPLLLREAEETGASLAAVYERRTRALWDELALRPDGDAAAWLLELPSFAAFEGAAAADAAASAGLSRDAFTLRPRGGRAFATVRATHAQASALAAALGDGLRAMQPLPHELLVDPGLEAAAGGAPLVDLEVRLAAASDGAPPPRCAPRSRPQRAALRRRAARWRRRAPGRWPCAACRPPGRARCRTRSRGSAAWRAWRS